MKRVEFRNYLGQPLFRAESPVPRKGEIIYNKTQKYYVNSVAYFYNDEAMYPVVYLKEDLEEE